MEGHVKGKNASQLKSPAGPGRLFEVWHEGRHARRAHVGGGWGGGCTSWGGAPGAPGAPGTNPAPAAFRLPTDLLLQSYPHSITSH